MLDSHFSLLSERENKLEDVWMCLCMCVTERKICNCSLIYTFDSHLIYKTAQSQRNSLSPFIHTGFAWEEEDDVVMVVRRRRMRLQWKVQSNHVVCRFGSLKHKQIWNHTLQLHLWAILQKRELNKTQQNKQPKNLPVSVFKSPFFARLDG